MAHNNDNIIAVAKSPAKLIIDLTGRAPKTVRCVHLQTSISRVDKSASTSQPSDVHASRSSFQYAHPIVSSVRRRDVKFVPFVSFVSFSLTELVIGNENTIGSARLPTEKPRSMLSAAELRLGPGKGLDAKETTLISAPPARPLPGKVISDPPALTLAPAISLT